MKRYVIAGNGVAAASCIEGIRSIDRTGPITVVSEEKRPVYCRPLISYYLEGKTDPERMLYRGADFYEKNACEVIYGKKAVRLDAAKKTVSLDDGTELFYDSLCVAAGSSPFVPPFDGLDGVSEKHSFMTLDDALGLEKAVDSTSRVLIVGAGLIGLKCAEGLSGRAGRITVCDLSERVLSSILDADCAKLVQTHLEKNGIEFLLGDTVARFEGGSALMKSGKTVGFDVLVLAVGVRANTGLVRDAGGVVNRGITVSEKLETSLPCVYAAGDCAEGLDVSSGGKKVMAILPNAAMQGYAAGVNMAGGDLAFDSGIPMNSIGFFGLHVMTAGTYDGELIEKRDGASVKRLYTKDDRLKGFIMIGCGERAGIYTSMIREGTPLSSVDFELMKETATPAAFTSDIRRKKYGGVV